MKAHHCARMAKKDDADPLVGGKRRARGDVHGMKKKMYAVSSFSLLSVSVGQLKSGI